MRLLLSRSSSKPIAFTRALERSRSWPASRSILSQLKEAGAELDKEHREDMDMVQEELTRLCQNREEDLEIRLMMLEILEVLNTRFLFFPSKIKLI